MKKDVNIMFLGGLFPKENEEEIYNNSKRNMQNAANVLQWNIVKGLDANINKPVKIVNSLFIGAYPKLYKKLMVKTYKFKHAQYAEDINVGFLNIWGIKYIVKEITLRPYVKQWVRCNKEGIVIAYSLNSVFIKLFKYIKMVNPNVKTCIIVPDLPEFMNTSNKSNLLYDIFKKKDIRKIEDNLMYVDNFVLLTEQMKEKLNIQNKHYVVVEGIIDEDIVDKEEKIEKFKEKTIMYTGTLNARYGVLDLVEAFKKIDKNNYRLIICGDGDSKEKIIRASKEDTRIIYKGLLKRDEVVLMQKKATILINPRKNDEEFCKYSFPSKIMEYLSSGTPVVAYQLDGMPKEYEDHITYIKGDSVEDMKNTLMQMAEKSIQELKLIGDENQRFILKSKTTKSQCKRIIDMLYEKSN